MTVLAYLCLCRVSIAIVRTLPGQQIHHTDLSKTKNVLQRASLSYSKWNAQLQHFSELNIMRKRARRMHFTNFRTWNPWQPGWPASLPTAPVTPEVALLPTHPSLHISALGREVTSARITQTGRMQRAHGLGANPDPLSCFEILSKLVNSFKLFTDQKNKILQCIGFGTVVRTKTTKD